jgi:hypothetical protein
VIDTELIRRRFVGVRHVAPYVVPALCDEVDALRAELAAEKARAERLAAAADNALMNAYPVSRNTITQDVNTYSISACELEPLREALKLYMPGDLGVSDNA